MNVHFLSALKILSENGWLGARDICRLEATTRCIRFNLVIREKVWESLCHQRWPNTTKILPVAITALGGYKTFFRHRTFSFNVAPLYRQSLLWAPPTILEQEFVILIDVKVGGKFAHSSALKGDELEQFLRNGIAHLEVNAAFCIGKAHCWFESPRGCKCKKDLCSYDPSDYDVVIHILRWVVGQGVSCFGYRPKLKNWEGELNAKSIGDPKREFYLPVNGESWLNCSPHDSISLNGSCPLHLNVCIEVGINSLGNKMCIVGLQMEAVNRKGESWISSNNNYGRKGVSLRDALQRGLCMGTNIHDPPQNQVAYTKMTSSLVTLD